MVSRRVSDCEHSRNEQGDVERESEDANKTIDKVSSNIPGHRSQKNAFRQRNRKDGSTADISIMAACRVTTNVVASQEILLSRRKAAQQSHFLLTHTPPRERSWTHVGLEQAFEGFFEQKRRKGLPVPTHRGQTIQDNPLESPNQARPEASDVLERLRPAAVVGPGDEGLRRQPPTTTSRRSYQEGWAQCRMGRFLFRQAGAEGFWSIRALVEEELNQHKEQWKVPDALIEHLGHTVEVANRFYKTPTYLKNMQSLVGRFARYLGSSWNYKAK